MSAHRVTVDAGGREPDEEQEAHSTPFLSVTSCPYFFSCPMWQHAHAYMRTCKNQKNHPMGTVYMKQGCDILGSGNVTFSLCPLALSELKMFSNSFRRSREV